jgi:hypothetical protein
LEAGGLLDEPEPLAPEPEEPLPVEPDELPLEPPGLLGAPPGDVLPPPGELGLVAPEPVDPLDPVPFCWDCFSPLGGQPSTPATSAVPSSTFHLFRIGPMRTPPFVPES